MAELRPGSQPQIQTARRQPGKRPEIEMRYTALYNEKMLLLSACKCVYVFNNN